MRRVDDLLLGHLDPGPLLHPVDHLARLALQVVGDDDRPLRGVDIELERVEPIAGREANIVGLAPRILKEQRAEPKSLTWAAAEEKVDWVREAAGERFDDLVFNVYPSGSPIVVTDDLRGEARKIIDRLKSRTGIELTEQEVIDSPHVYIGSIDRFVEKFRELRERIGVSSFLVGDLTELGPVVERLAGT